VNAPLALAAQNDRRLRDELLARWPTLAEDEPALWDTLEGCSDGSFDVQLSIALRMADEARMMADGIAVRQEELAERKRRLSEREEAIRRAILSAMEMVGRKTITLPEATITISRTAPSLLVPDETKVGPGPWWVTPPPKLSKSALKDAIVGEGRVVAGAYMSNGGSQLQIRRR
jgi:hypothetical protein